MQTSHRGVSAVELGIFLPLLVGLLLGIMDYGYVYFVRLTMANAAWEGARVGVTRESGAQAQSDAETVATAYLAGAGLDARVRTAGPSMADPSVTVTITLEPFRALIGFVPTPRRLESSAAMRWQLAADPARRQGRAAHAATTGDSQL